MAEIDSACVTNRVERDALGRVAAVLDGRGNRRDYVYDARGLLASETDAAGATTAYGYDVMGRTIAMTNALGNVTVYEYDARGNKTYEGGAVYPVRYGYDAFGNRTVAEGKTYTANALNQYTKIADFVPEYDADGNQTLIQTATGVWQVTYNAENRPVRWQSGDTIITMAFDRMGRRVEMRTVTPSTAPFTSTAKCRQMIVTMR